MSKTARPTVGGFRRRQTGEKKMKRVVAPYSAKVGQVVELSSGKKVVIDRLYSYRPSDDEMCIYHSHQVTLMDCTVIA
jgi:hypothetical protein